MPVHLQFIMKKSFLRSLLNTYLITLSLEKEIIVLEKISKIVGPKICTNPVEQTNNKPYVLQTKEVEVFLVLDCIVQ